MKAQWRRTISLAPEVYVRLRDYCEKHKDSMAAFVCEAVMSSLDDLGAPTVTVHDARKRIQPRKRRRTS